MELSKAAITAIHGLACVADFEGQGPVDISEISQRLSMPREYMAKTFQRLSRSQLIYSKRGPKGGYLLGRPPRNITLLDVVEAIDGPILTGVCEFRLGERCRFFDNCKIRTQLDNLKEKTRKLYKSVTIADFRNQFKGE